jgi:adenylate cyclase
MSVRLACQLRPRADLSVTPLLPATATAAHAMERTRYQRSEERTVALLFADMRGFTRLAESRLPYDVVFVLNRYREEMAHHRGRWRGQRVRRRWRDGLFAWTATSQQVAARQSRRRMACRRLTPQSDACRRAERAAAHRHRHPPAR